VSRPILLYTALSRIICQFYQLLDYVSIGLPARLIEWKKRKTRCIRFEAFATTAHNGVFLSYQPPENEVSNHISNCLHLHELRWRLTCLFFLIYSGQCPEPSHTLSLLRNFVSFCQRGSDVGQCDECLPHTWATSTVDICVARNKSCGNWDSFEYLDIISTLSGVLPKENFTANDRLPASLIDWTTLCSKKSMTFFSRNSRDYQVVCSSSNLRAHEQRPSLTVAWSGSNTS
jgi:hypothetical protein